MSGDDDFVWRDLDEVTAIGAALDSAQSEAEVMALPRLLRYAIQALDQDVSNRLVAEVAEIAPDLKEKVAAWAEGKKRAHWRTLAARFDRMAVETDRPALRAMSDVTRLVSMDLGAVGTHRADTLRVVAGLRATLNETRRHIIPVKYLATLEYLIVGWTHLLSGQKEERQYRGQLAHRQAYDLGKSATGFVRTAIREQGREEAERARPSEKAGPESAATEADDSAAIEVPEGHCLVCPSLDLRRNPKAKDASRGHEHAIGTPLPLAPMREIAQIRRQLVFEFPYAEYAIDLLLAPLTGRSYVHFPPVILLGPPGAGKTRLARRLAEVLGVGLWRTDAARADGNAFAGTDRRWSSSEPAHPFLAVSRTRIANPLVLVDEIEKAGTRSDYGRLWDALLGLLEPETARRYPDPCLQADLDLSHVSYVATANLLGQLPSPLLDRFRLIEMPEPRSSDLDRLIKPLLADIAREQGLDERWIVPITAEEKEFLTAKWHGGSVRRLRRYVDVIVRAGERMRSVN